MPADTTQDAVLGGRLVLAQPRRGHRVGHDAILLAAATPARPGEYVVELGAGVGAAGLALARRVADLTVTLVEIDPALAALARRNAEANGLAARVRSVALDVTARAAAFTAAGLAPQSAARVLMNPPFNDPRQVSADPARRRAHAAQPGTLAIWAKRADRLLVPGGTLTLIWRADGLAHVLGALGRGFGGLAVLPVHPAPAAAAIRVLVHAVKGSRAPLALLPPLVLNCAEGGPTATAEAVLREGGTLPLAHL